MRTNRICNRCGTEVVFETDEDLKKEYPFYCPTCDENMYYIETKSAKTTNKETTMNTKTNFTGVKTMVNNNVCPTCGQRLPNNKKAQRIAALKAMGFDFSSNFSLSFDDGETISASDINDPVAKEIYANGYVANTALHRRWITAQTFRLLGNDDDWTRRFNCRYSNWNYQLKMVMEECRVLDKMRNDKDTFDERSSIFTLNAVGKIISDYFRDVVNYIVDIEANANKKCRGKVYCTIHGKNYFPEDLNKMFNEYEETSLEIAKNLRSYEEAYSLLNNIVKGKWFFKITSTSKTFTDAFKKSGCYYTLKNIIQFHKCTLEDMDMDESLREIRSMLDNGDEGWRFLGLLKAVVNENNFNFIKAISK